MEYITDYVYLRRAGVVIRSCSGSIHIWTIVRRRINWNAARLRHWTLPIAFTSKTAGQRSSAISKIVWTITLWLWIAVPIKILGQGRKITVEVGGTLWPRQAIRSSINSSRWIRIHWRTIWIWNGITAGRSTVRKYSPTLNWWRFLLCSASALTWLRFVFYLHILLTIGYCNICNICWTLQGGCFYRLQGFCKLVLLCM